MIWRGEVYWFDSPVAIKSRPVLVVSCDEMNESRVDTCVVAAITSTPARAGRPGWVPIRVRSTDGEVSGSVNLSALNTVRKSELRSHIGTVSLAELDEIDDALRFVLFNRRPAL